MRTVLKNSAFLFILSPLFILLGQNAQAQDFNPRPWTIEVTDCDSYLEFMEASYYYFKDNLFSLNDIRNPSDPETKKKGEELLKNIDKIDAKRRESEANAWYKKCENDDAFNKEYQRIEGNFKTLMNNYNPDNEDGDKPEEEFEEAVEESASSSKNPVVQEILSLPLNDCDDYLVFVEKVYDWLYENKDEMRAFKNAAEGQESPDLAPEFKNDIIAVFMKLGAASETDWYSTCEKDKTFKAKLDGWEKKFKALSGE